MARSSGDPSEWSSILLRRTVICYAFFALSLLSEENAKSEANSHQQQQQQTAFLREYCQQEFFVASCPDPSGLVVMETARYGRMREGHCITGNYGKLNCSKDALWFFDRRCSGRSRCRVFVGDPSLVKLNPCHAKDLVSYLEARYRCITVASGTTQQCRSNRPILLTSNVSYISSELAVSAGIGTPECPFRIQAPAGQRIQLTLVLFTGKEAPPDEATAAEDSNQGHPTSGTCYEIGSVYGEAGQRKTLTACSDVSRGTVANVLHRSDDNELTLELHTKYDLKELAPFLIKYESVGCQLPSALPTGAWMKTTPDTALIGCNGSAQESWTLTCAGSRWIGSVGNCTGSSSLFGASSTIQADDAFPYGILMVVAIGVALGVFVGGTLLTIVAFCMKRARPESVPAIDYLSAAEALDDPCALTDTVIAGLRCPSSSSSHHQRRYRLNPVPLIGASCYPPLSSSEQADAALTTLYDDRNLVLCRGMGKGLLGACPSSGGCTAALVQPLNPMPAGANLVPGGGRLQRSLHLYETPQFG